MTKREKEKVRWAIDNLMADDGDFAGAIQALCEMVGWDYPAGRLAKEMRRVSLQELATRPAQPFVAPARTVGRVKEGDGECRTRKEARG